MWSFFYYGVVYAIFGMQKYAKIAKYNTVVWALDDYIFQFTSNYVHLVFKKINHHGSMKNDLLLLSFDWLDFAMRSLKEGDIGDRTYHDGDE